MPSAKTYGGIGAILKGIGQTTGEMALLNRFAEEREEKKKLQAFLNEMETARLNAQRPREGMNIPGVSLTDEYSGGGLPPNLNAPNISGGYNMGQQFEPRGVDTNAPSTPTMLELLKLQEQQLKNTKLEKQIAEMGKTESTLSKDKEAYRKFALKWDSNNGPVPSFGEYKTKGSGTGMPGADVKKFVVGSPPGEDKKTGGLSPEEEADYQRLLKKYAK